MIMQQELLSEPSVVKKAYEFNLDVVKKMAAGFKEKDVKNITQKVIDGEFADVAEKGRYEKFDIVENKSASFCTSTPVISVNTL